MDNFDLRKYLAEGRLFKENLNLDIEDNTAILSGNSGEYESEIKDGKVSFSVIYDDLDYRISDQYNENNIEDFLGKGHAFVELAKKYDHNWDIERDLVGITVELEDLKGIMNDKGDGGEDSGAAVAYLRKIFQQYLEGGDTFKGAPGDIETVVWDGEEYGDPENYNNADQFRSTLQRLTNTSFSFTPIGYPEYGEVTFKRKGNDIIGSFTVPEQ
jgi:hypothetical protein